MTSTIRKVAVAAALASGLAIGGVGVTQAFAQSASPTANSTANSGNSGSSGNANRSGNADNCPQHNASSSSSNAGTST